MIVEQKMLIHTPYKRTNWMHSIHGSHLSHHLYEKEETNSYQPRAGIYRQVIHSQEHTFTKELANTKSMYWLTPQLTITGAHALPTQQKAESTDLTCNSVSAFY